MITGLLGWFARKPANKRVYPRKEEPYRAAYLVDGVEHPAIGLDLSAGGMSFLAQERIADKEVDVVLQADRRIIRARVSVVRETPSTYRGALVYRYGTQYTGIKADDWDAIVRYTTGGDASEFLNKAQEDLHRVRMSPDDMARLLPLDLQNRILHRLVQLHRLAPLDERRTPLVQYFYEGIERRDNVLMHRLTIQSKMLGHDGEPSLYETTVIFDDRGKHIQIIDEYSEREAAAKREAAKPAAVKAEAPKPEPAKLD